MTEPDHQARPVVPAEFVHHGSLKEDAKYRPRGPQGGRKGRAAADWCGRKIITACTP